MRAETTVYTNKKCHWLDQVPAEQASCVLMWLTYKILIQVELQLGLVGDEPRRRSGRRQVTHPTTQHESIDHWMASCRDSDRSSGRPATLVTWSQLVDCENVVDNYLTNKSVRGAHREARCVAAGGTQLLMTPSERATR